MKHEGSDPGPYVELVRSALHGFITLLALFLVVPLSPHQAPLSLAMNR